MAAAHNQQSAALVSDRAGMTREAVDPEHAAELLNTAEAMLRAQPESHAAKCSHVEVCFSHLAPLTH